MAESLYGGVVMQEAMKSFSNIIAPITAMSYATDNSALNVGDTVKVPYATPNSSSTSFSYSSGYGSNNSTQLGVRPVTLSNLFFQRFVINDTDASKLDNNSILTFAKQAGEKLAGDVISASFAAIITDGNYPTSASCTYGQLTSSNAIADLVKQADDANWTTENRNIILGSAAWNSLIKNTNLSNAYSFGGSQVIQSGLPTNVMGFNTYKVTVPMPNGCKALVLNPTSILFATGQHKPSEVSKPTVQFFSSQEKGITITMRNWYDANAAQTVYVLECLFGTATGNGAGLYQMK